MKLWLPHKKQAKKIYKVEYQTKSVLNNEIIKHINKKRTKKNLKIIKIKFDI